MCLGRVALSRFQPLAGGVGRALNGVPVSFHEPLKPRADGIQPGVNLPLAIWQGPGLAVHAFQHA